MNLKRDLLLVGLLMVVAPRAAVAVPTVAPTISLTPGGVLPTFGYQLWNENWAVHCSTPGPNTSYGWFPVKVLYAVYRYPDGGDVADTGGGLGLNLGTTGNPDEGTVTGVTLPEGAVLYPTWDGVACSTGVNSSSAAVSVTGPQVISAPILSLQFLDTQAGGIRTYDSGHAPAHTVMKPSLLIGAHPGPLEKLGVHLEGPGLSVYREYASGDAYLTDPLQITTGDPGTVRVWVDFVPHGVLSNEVHFTVVPLAQATFDNGAPVVEPAGTSGTTDGAPPEKKKGGCDGTAADCSPLALLALGLLRRRGR